jgi:hypothetical protein
MLAALAMFAAAHVCSAGTPGAWTDGPSMMLSRYAHTATLLASGKVLVAGGTSSDDGSGQSPDIGRPEIYDPDTNTWDWAGTFANWRFHATATLLQSGKVLLVGGENHSSTIASAQLYDPATNDWSDGGTIDPPRFLHTATLLPSGKVLVAGGRYEYLSAVPTDNAELYDPDSNTWAPTASLITARYGHFATLLPSGKVLVVGGFGPDESSPGAELYDPATETWSAAAPLPATIEFPDSLSVLPSGAALVVGSTDDFHSSTALYDADTDAWILAGELVTGRYSAVPAVLQSGQVLDTGGWGDAGPLGSCEIFDPAADTWSETGSFGFAISGHTATVLRSGQVLVTGGNVWFGNTEFTSNGSSLYEPPSSSNADADDDCFESGFDGDRP